MVCNYTCIFTSKTMTKKFHTSKEPNVSLLVKPTLSVDDVPQEVKNLVQKLQQSMQDFFATNAGKQVFGLYGHGCQELVKFYKEFVNNIDILEIHKQTL